MKATMWTPEIDRKGDSEREIEILINAITKTKYIYEYYRCYQKNFMST